MEAATTPEDDGGFGSTGEDSEGAAAGAPLSFALPVGLVGPKARTQK